MRTLVLVALVALAGCASSAIAATDTVDDLRTRFWAEMKKPREQESPDLYADLLRRLDAIIAGLPDEPGPSPRRDAEGLRYEINLAHERTLEARRVAERRAQEARRAEQEARRAEEARSRAIRQKGWPADVTNNVIARRIAVGMTAEQVTMAWGKPQSVNETLTRNTTREQWVYGIGQYLYFENGKLTAIQRSR